MITIKILKKKNILLLFSLSAMLFSNFTYAQQLVERIVIPNNEKNISNLSGAIDSTKSFHLIINKDLKSKMYRSTLQIIDKKGQISKFPYIITKKSPNYLTFHINNTILTTINEIEKGIKIIDYDILNKTIDSISIKRTVPKSILAQNDVTFITSKYFPNNLILLLKIKSSKNATKMVVKANNKIETTFLKNINDREKAEFINDKQYINFGSIKMYKGFYKDDTIIYLMDNKKNSTVTIFKIDEKGNLSERVLDLNNKQKARKQNSFLKDSLLFTFNMRSEKALLDIYNFKTLKLLKRLEFKKNEIKNVNKLVKNGKDVTKHYKSSSFYNSFFGSIGSTYNPALFINVNKSKDNDYVIKVGHVDKNKYNNRAANNFWWNSPAFALNFNSGGFSSSINPIIGAQLLIYEAFAANKRKGNYFQIVLDKNLNQVDKKPEFEYYFFNEKMYKRKLKTGLSLKKEFLIPLNDFVRFINYNSSLKTYDIYNLGKYKF